MKEAGSSTDDLLSGGLLPHTLKTGKGSRAAEKRQGGEPDAASSMDTNA